MVKKRYNAPNPLNGKSSLQSVRCREPWVLKTRYAMPKMNGPVRANPKAEPSRGDGVDRAVTSESAYDRTHRVGAKCVKPGGTAGMFRSCPCKEFICGGRGVFLCPNLRIA